MPRNKSRLLAGRLESRLRESPGRDLEAKLGTAGNREDLGDPTICEMILPAHRAQSAQTFPSEFPTTSRNGLPLSESPSPGNSGRLADDSTGETGEAKKTAISSLRDRGRRRAQLREVRRRIRHRGTRVCIFGF